ncbi:alpha-1,2-fucosyltransferase [Candidatus Pelagibacter sp. Uisw_090]|uniref:alpha-1,2-fucosyltransferase n=1 Tax=Candidatus Pelagibacter sp. Uisw_090 TaxID=3230993 RepID=UPI0039EBE215
MKNKLIVRIAEGLGNQMFMYANAFNLSKEIKYELFIDDESGYFKKKDIKSYQLNNFNVSSNIVNDKYKFNTSLKNIRRKFLIKYDKLPGKNKFIIEDKFEKKKTKFEAINTENLSKIVYLEGNYESEKYFNLNRELLLKEFEINNTDMLINNKYHNFIMQNKDRIISVCVRTNRYSERINNHNSNIAKSKSDKFTMDNIEYIYRAIKDFPKKIKNPIFLLWSNDFKGLSEYFDNKKFIFIDNEKNKTVLDFYLLTLCNNFIVGPTSFHWWGSWLSKDKDKTCVRPKNINQSSNINFWPESWFNL